MQYKPLSKDEMRSVIEGRGAAARVPMIFKFWTNSNVFGSESIKVEKLFEKYPEDIQAIPLNMPDIYNAPEDAPGYRWANYSSKTDESKAIDDRVVFNDWSQLDDVLKDFPDPNYHGLTVNNPPSDGRYRLGTFWFWYFERLWMLRGMTNTLLDFYENPDEVHRIFRAFTDFYLVLLERGKKEQNLDGIFTSDDIGTQNGPFFSAAIFKEFFKPYYKEVIEKAHELGMHFWLHTCGDINLFMEDFIEIGLDVIHPIQKYSMDEKSVAEKYGKDICIWAGFDVQQTIPRGSPDDVRKEVRFMIDTYYRRDGRFMMTAGNALTEDCPLVSLEALLDETYSYGSKE